MYEAITSAILDSDDLELSIMNANKKHDDCKALKIAIKERQPDIVKFFISNGYDTSCICVNPLKISIKYGDLYITKYLSHMYDINIKHIKLAVENGDFDMVKFLIKKTDNISKKDLIEAISISRNTNMLLCKFLEQVYTNKNYN